MTILRIMTNASCAVLLCAAGLSQANAEELGRGSGVTITKAAYTWRIARTDADAPCANRTQPRCRTTTLTVENTSAQPMACVGQLRFFIAAAPPATSSGASSSVPPTTSGTASATKPAAAPASQDISWTENAGLTVAAGAASPVIVSEYPDRLDLQRSFVACWTTQERDEADDGDAPFARAAPAACKVQLASSPDLADFFPTGSQAANEGGLVSVRIALPLPDGQPKVLGINTSSGFLRIDRAALLLASRMNFKTNCPGTQRLLPIRFQLKE